MGAFWSQNIAGEFLCTPCPLLFNYQSKSNCEEIVDYLKELEKLSPVAAKVQIVQRYIDSGGDINVKGDYFQYTPLTFAAFEGCLKTVQFLCGKGADISIEAECGGTCLHLAARGGHLDIVRYLIEVNKCDYTKRNKWSLNPLHYAAAGSHTNVVKYLYELLCKTDGKFNSWCLLKKFRRVAVNFLPTIDLEHVKLLTPGIFKKAGKFPIFEKCVNNDWLATGKDVNQKSKVLFISHRWETDSHPDPNGYQYSAVLKYLDESHIEFDFIWLDYSCIPQADKAGKAFSNHLANIPTSIILATHCFIVPAMDFKEGISDLVDYCARGWCILEVCLAKLSATRVCCHFSYKGQEQAIDLVPPKGTEQFLDVGSFHHATRKALEKLGKTFADEPALRQMWGVEVDPARVLARTIVATGSYKTFAPEVFDGICSMKLDERDINQPSAHPIVKPIMESAYAQGGDYTGNGDRIIVFRLFLFTIAYLLDLEPKNKCHLGRKSREPYKNEEVAKDKTLLHQTKY